METRSEHKCFGGTVGFYSHWSPETESTMNFSVFVPPGNGPFPVLTFLSGLTCSEENFQVKSGAQRFAAERGVMLVNPDTSPRGCGVKGEDVDWDFGIGAGFYLNATQIPWKKHYRMYDYVVKDLSREVFRHFPGNPELQGIFGHSMGGHGALVIGLRNPGVFKSISAFAPISSPMRCPWGQKAFSHYLGESRKTWEEYDASSLVARIKQAGKRPQILVDQGLSDEWMVEQLKPELLEEGAAKSGYPVRLRRHKGYDHGYYFISTFMADHFDHHGKFLGF